MNIIVCVKQVIDPEAPQSSFKLDADALQAVMQGSPPVIDPYGEYAVEAALRLKDTAGAKVTAISLGDGLQREVVKKPLSMGADELILLEDEKFTGGDSWATAAALAAAIRKAGEYDLILCGREASDSNAGQTGPGIAARLGLPCVTLARQIDIDGDKARVVRVTADGHEVVEVPLPAVITVSNEVGEPRYPTIKGIMGAKKIEPVVWKPSDIGLEAAGAAARRCRMVKLYAPAREGKCEMAAGETEAEAGQSLACMLREAKIF